MQVFRGGRGAAETIRFLPPVPEVETQNHFLLFDALHNYHLTGPTGFDMHKYTYSHVCTLGTRSLDVARALRKASMHAFSGIGQKLVYQLPHVLCRVPSHLANLRLTRQLQVDSFLHGVVRVCPSHSCQTWRSNSVADSSLHVPYPLLHGACRLTVHDRVGGRECYNARCEDGGIVPECTNCRPDGEALEYLRVRDRCDAVRT